MIKMMLKDKKRVELLAKNIDDISSNVALNIKLIFNILTSKIGLIINSIFILIIIPFLIFKGLFKER